MDAESRYWAIREQLVLASGSDRGITFVSQPDDVIGRHVFMNGNFGRETVEEFVGRLPASLTRRRFIDVGANIGMTAITALRRGGFEAAVCFEPRDDLLPILRANLALNDMLSRATVHGVALSSRSGPIEFSVDEENLGDGRVMVYGPSIRAGGATTRRVVVGAVGRDLLGPIDPQSDVLWMDVQGHEMDVLLGLDTSRGVPITCLELDPDLLAPKWSVDDVVDVLRELGYRSFIGLHAPQGLGPLPVGSALRDALAELSSRRGWGDFMLRP